MNGILAVLLTSKALYFMAFCLGTLLAASMAVLLFLIVLERRAIESEIK
jgi:hypothetical protein